jgi:hypothetical protein
MKRIYVLPSYGSEESIKSSSWSDKVFKRYLKFSICLLVCIFLFAMNAPILYTLFTKFSGLQNDQTSAPLLNDTRAINETDLQERIALQDAQEKVATEENEKKLNLHEKELQEEIYLHDAQMKALKELQENNTKGEIVVPDCGSNCTSEKIIPPMKSKLANVSTEQVKPTEKISKPVEKAKKLMEKLSKLTDSSTIKHKNVTQVHPTTVVYSKDAIDSTQVLDSIIGLREEPAVKEIKLENPSTVEKTKPKYPPTLKAIKLEDPPMIKEEPVEKTQTRPTAEKAYNLPTD